MHDEVTSSAPTGADRRAFLLRAGLGTAAVAAVATAGPSLASTGTTGSDDPSTLDLVTAEAAATGPVTAYVRNAARGEIGVLVGQSEHIIVDKAAVARLLAAAGR
jgi:hypothetical protein